jgi:transcriptional regulator with XRE-family HTH domain
MYVLNSPDYEDDYREPCIVKTPEKELARRLRIRRQELGWSQQELANKINDDGRFNFTQPKISNAERNGKLLVTEFFAIIKALKSDIRDFVV